MYDAYVLPARQLSKLLDRMPELFRRKPYIVYGKPEALEAAFRAGCSDFLKEAWTPAEMYIRLRRLIPENEIDLGFGKMTFSDFSVSIDDRKEKLNRQEYLLLRCLCRNRGTVVPREVLFYELWGSEGGNSRVVDMHVVNLRKKLRRLVRNEKSDAIIYTVRGSGYSIP
jgi:DNA-binding response OmpR family regulator